MTVLEVAVDMVKVMISGAPVYVASRLLAGVLALVLILLLVS